jgi:hypothetical protein
MGTQSLGRVFYWQGYPPWGNQTRDGELILAPPNLVFQADTQGRIEMPLVNAKGERMSIRAYYGLEKRGLEGFLASLPGLSMDWQAHGLSVMFGDKVGDWQSVYFRCEERTAEMITQIVQKAIFEQRHEGKIEVEPSNSQDKSKLLKNLAELRDAGILTEEEFQRKKAEILSRI